MSVLLLEAFHGGSHQQLIDLLQANIEDCVTYTLPAKKWHWRARTAALYFMQAIPASPSYRVLLTSSVLNLAELVALRPDLGRLKKILYFHENQLVYPVRKSQERDFQYGYNQVLSCLVADTVAFNSCFNMESFLSSIPSFFKTMPDHRPRDLDKLIRPKCQVLYFPIRFSNVTRFLPEHKLQNRPGQSQGDDITQRQKVNDLVDQRRTDGSLLSASEVSSDSPEGCVRTQSLTVNRRQESGGPHQCEPAQFPPSARPLRIVWPHRWEHDKDPELFFNTMLKLKERGFSFHFSVLGETFTDVPDIFAEAKVRLADHILHWGFLPSKEDYLNALCQADVVVSTAKHEFFGVAMLEAVHCGCYPLCPKALVYPEIFPAEYLYSTPEQLCKRLQAFCTRPGIVRRHSVKVDPTLFSWEKLGEKFKDLLAFDCQTMPEQNSAEVRSSEPAEIHLGL
ncbi:tRNA-queuosine alpha-mannosyltransferase [Denticeps clupeoides]|uniref:tRNA-queuosine alpha-mannosyltransferase n=1 Tax=Denticeps clupeoides TaxID=299321 RepID=A0AAY4ASF7_9TELE|nr:glycosyltransferase-like domain-containing protein 1 [Denticeps clupeoides]XP_028847639.1 glycosyltransferase-like domain-containing protein 1 [Denticeps clupeoides]XP_028847640.1 glycosyltransferase-like domain-containing protein 1 [Denticeps clupeoides]XP_028847641.1 glycosyltransferase-like domain-containing protein 1 [Denticeps clupeoides]XP_028847642.1 glycosyltransferase-like domain-containing protein 1 [Denticeps clupeoides]